MNKKDNISGSFKNVRMNDDGLKKILIKQKKKKTFSSKETKYKKPFASVKYGRTNT